MGRLRELTYREVTARLRQLGFRFHREGKGSHELWVRDSDGRVVPVPHHAKPIRKGTLRAIIRQVGDEVIYLSVEHLYRVLAESSRCRQAFAVTTPMKRRLNAVLLGG